MVDRSEASEDLFNSDEPVLGRIRNVAIAETFLSLVIQSRNIIKQASPVIQRDADFAAA
jgi:hypothetical protein